MPEGYRTACKYCYFAKYEGDTQVGCSLDRLDKFVNNGATIVDAYDNEKNFFVIEGRLCSALRPKEWAAEFENPIEQVYKELELDIEVFIYADSETKNDDVFKTINSILASKLKIHKITIIDNFSQIKQSDLVIFFKKQKIWKWRIEQIVNKVETLEEALDLTVLTKKVNSTYMFVTKAGLQISDGYFKHLDNLINVDLQRFVLDTSVVGPFFTLTNLYKNVNGNKGEKFFLKVLELAAEQESGILMPRA